MVGSERRDQLSRLVQEAQTAGDSYQDLADRAVDPVTGATVSKPYLHKLARGQVATAPGPAQLRAIAAALRRPAALVQRAAAEQFLGWVSDELQGYDDDMRVIVTYAEAMPPAERRQLRATVEAWERARAEER